jgi:hypothetical protein
MWDGQDGARFGKMVGDTGQDCGLAATCRRRRGRWSTHGVEGNGQWVGPRDNSKWQQATMLSGPAQFKPLSIIHQIFQIFKPSQTCKI